VFGMTDFEHERLDVYRAAIAWLIIADEIAERLPRGRAYLVDQLRRAATSVVLNIAEGAGEFSPGDKARFYRMARRSATECAATLDVSRAIKLVDPELVSKGRELLLRVVAMLTAMVLRLNDGSDSGSGREALQECSRARHDDRAAIW
jgi:four helix bundle protein